MSEPAERAIPLPLAFDTAIGYWTGEPDWELVEAAVSACAGAAVAERLAGHRQGGAPVECSGFILEIAETTLLVRGEPAVVERFAAEVEERLAGGGRR